MNENENQIVVYQPDEDYAAVVGSWPKDYDRILNGESATMLAMDAAEGRLG